MGTQRATAEAAAEERVSPHLWAAAFAGSLIAHLATGAALAPLLGAERMRKPATEITFAGPSAEDAVFMPAVAQAPAESSAAVAARTPAETQTLAAGAAERAGQAGDTEALPQSPPQAEKLAALAPADTPTASPPGTRKLTPAPAATAALPVMPAELSPASEAAAIEENRPDTSLAALSDASLKAQVAVAAPVSVLQEDAFLAPTAGAATAVAAGVPAVAGERLAPAEPALPSMPGVAAMETGKPRQPAAVPLTPLGSSSPTTASAPATQTVAAVSLTTGSATRAGSSAQRLAPLPLSSAAGQAATTAASPPDRMTAGSGGDAAAGDEGARQVAALAPERPTVPPSPWEGGKAFAKRFAGGPCFAVMPAERAGVVSLEGFGIGDAAMQRFTEAARGLGPETELGFSRLSQAQCEAVDFFRLASARSDFPMAIRIDTPRVEDHGAVIGEIVRPIGKPVWLVLVDDEGEVWSIGRIAPDDGDGRIQFPVNLTSSAVGTQQLLVAISSDAVPGEDYSGRHERTAAFFSRLRRTIEEAGAEADIAIASFSVDMAEGSE